MIFLNGHHLKECIYQYIELWKDDFGADYEKFKTWFTKYCYVCATLVDRIVPGFPRKEIAQIQKKINSQGIMIRPLLLSPLNVLKRRNSNWVSLPG